LLFGDRDRGLAHDRIGVRIHPVRDGAITLAALAGDEFDP
jgi:hypothetical protein